jgi:hypothetical protein
MVGLITLMISGCTTIKYEPVELTLPPPLGEEQRLTNEELECVSDKTYQKIVTLDKRRSTLRSIILSTKQQQE